MELTARINKTFSEISSKQNLTNVGHKTVDLRTTDITLPTPEFPKTTKVKGCFIFSNKIPRRYRDAPEYAFRLELRRSADKRYNLTLIWKSDGTGPYNCTVYYATDNPNLEDISWN